MQSSKPGSSPSLISGLWAQLHHLSEQISMRPVNNEYFAFHYPEDVFFF